MMIRCFCKQNVVVRAARLRSPYGVRSASLVRNYDSIKPLLGQWLDNDRENQTQNLHQRRFYCASLIQMESKDSQPNARNDKEENQEEEDQEEPEYRIPSKKEIALASRDYNLRRANYKRQVSLLRKEYFKEYQQQQQKEEALEKAQKEKEHREKLIRQREKNVRSAANQRKQEEYRLKMAAKFQEHLERQQMIRDATRLRYQRARQMIIQELEDESEHWLTTTDEVDAAFDDFANSQKLWARHSGGILGAPSPSIDSSFWAYESHTHNMDKTYPSQRQVVLDELLENVYDVANIDYENYWNINDNLVKQLQLENKAKLRAMVRLEGRKILLQKQRDILVKQYGNTNSDDPSANLDDSNRDGTYIPKIMPAPNVKILANVKAMEDEGASVLLSDPTKFFEFDNSAAAAQAEHGDQHEQSDDIGTSLSSYSGPSLGKPVRLRDWVNEDYMPRAIAKLEKPDTRTAAQKKRDEREEKLWAAANKEEMMGDQDVDEIELAATETSAGDALENPIDYDTNDDLWDKEDSDDWMKGLDAQTDQDIIRETPHDKRLNKEDIQWIIDEMEKKMQYLQHQLIRDVSGYKYHVQSSTASKTIDGEERAEDDHQVQTGSDSTTATAAIGTGDADELNELDKMLLTLKDEQIIALSDIDDQLNDGSISTEEQLLQEIKQIPGLTEEQISIFLDALKE